MKKDKKISFKITGSRYWSLFCGFIFQKRFLIDPSNRMLVHRGTLIQRSIVQQTFKTLNQRTMTGFLTVSPVYRCVCVEGADIRQFVRGFNITGNNYTCMEYMVYLVVIMMPLLLGIWKPKAAIHIQDSSSSYFFYRVKMENLYDDDEDADADDLDRNYFNDGNISVSFS